MTLLNRIDRRADALVLADVHRMEAWTTLCAEFPEVHSNTLAERLAASLIANGKDAGVFA